MDEDEIDETVRGLEMVNIGMETLCQENKRLERMVERKDKELKNTRDQLYGFLCENNMPKKRIEYFLQDIDKAIAYDGSEEWHTIKPK